MKDNVSDAEKKQRLNELQELLNVYATERSEKLLGSIQSCLVSGKSKKNKDEYQARTECNRVVNFDSNGIDLAGQLVNIRINDVLANSLRGTIEH